MNTIPEDAMPPELHARLSRLRETAATIQPPAYVESQLTERLFGPAPGALSAPAGSTIAAARPARAPSWLERWGAWFAWPVSVTAAAGLVSWMVYTNPAIAPEELEPSFESQRREVPADTTAATPFLALTSLDNIPAGAGSEIVSATLPRSTLAEFGLPVSPMRAAEPIDAEFLIGANGGVLAVRFIESAAR